MEVATGYQVGAPKRPVTMRRNADLVRIAEGMAGDLSATVERLLAAFIEYTVWERQIAAHIVVHDAFVARHGSLVDEFSGL